MGDAALECNEACLELPATKNNIAHARRTVGDLAGRVGAVEFDVKLAVSEAVSNVVQHAYRDRDPGLVRVWARVRRRKLVISVSDDGSGMRPNFESPGLGLGLPLIAKVSIDMRIDSSGPGLTVSMAFPLPQA
jgi:anti-sigma regulatory factor (Ser/Thr protein kinase)